MYKTIVIEYTPKAEKKKKKIEEKCNNMKKDNYNLVTMSITGSAKAILVFKED